MAVGDTFPTQQIVYTGPFGESGTRLTTDGQLQQYQVITDSSGEQIPGSWSKQSDRIVYGKGNFGGTKAEGIYVQTIATGQELCVALVAAFQSSPVFARDASNEVYYFKRVSGATEVRAVNSVTPVGTDRLISSFATTNTNREKIMTNVDGTLIAVTIANSTGFWKTLVLNPATGVVKANWDMAQTGSSDNGAFWHPTDPNKIICARNNTWGLYDVNTNPDAQNPPVPLVAGLDTAHAATVSNGTTPFQLGIIPLRLVNIDTGAVTFNFGGAYSPHPFINQFEASLGMGAHVVFDEEGGIVNGTGGLALNRPVLWYSTLTEIQAHGHWRGAGVIKGAHWTNRSSNGAHAHPQISPDGTKLLWISDKLAFSGGTSGFPSGDLTGITAPPGGTGGGEDLFMITLASAPTATPIMNIRGITGANGVTGIAGVFTTWFTGSGTPSGALGLNNDYYMDSVSGDVWKKVAGAWV